MKSKCNVIDIIAGILVFIGAINWGLVGIFDFNVVTAIFGDMNLATRIVYIVIGVAGLWMLYGCCRCCNKSACAANDAPKKTTKKRSK